MGRRLRDAFEASRREKKKVESPGRLGADARCPVPERSKVSPRRWSFFVVAFFFGRVVVILYATEEWRRAFSFCDLVKQRGLLLWGLENAGGVSAVAGRKKVRVLRAARR